MGHREAARDHLQEQQLTQRRQQQDPREQQLEQQQQPQRDLRLLRVQQQLLQLEPGQAQQLLREHLARLSAQHGAGSVESSVPHLTRPRGRPRRTTSWKQPMKKTWSRWGTQKKRPERHVVATLPTNGQSQQMPTPDRCHPMCEERHSVASLQELGQG